MKCSIPEISWHNREPVLSVHIQPISEKFYRLATGGADCHVLIWQLIINDKGAVKTEALADLTRHQRAVNSVQWSPSGEYLATADDDANIIVWQLKTDNIPLLEGETNDRETWIVNKVMRGHKEDIYDLCWSPNGLKLLSGSVDNTAILWDFAKGKNEQILTDHKGFVQGVAWDPKGLYVATISTDRVCRIYDSYGKQVKSRIQKGYLPVPESHYLYNKDVKFFYDDTFKSFFRRLDFSPDGSLLAVPSGRIEIEDCKKILNATLIFAVESWAAPVAILPSGKQCSTVVRFCPILFEIHEAGPESVISLPFRMIMAVGTDHDVILYDTQQMEPFAYFKDIHYTRLTDLTWSHDGLLLVASSTDGYCALITFESEELGVRYVKEESEAEESVLDVSGCEMLEKEENVEVKPKKLNLLEKWTVKTPKKNKSGIPVAGTSKDSEVMTIEDDYNEDTSKRKREDEAKIEVPCKRIKPVLVKTEPKKNEVTCKRIKPVLIESKKVTNDNQKKENASTNSAKIVSSSPLINFLKGAQTRKSEKSNTKTVPTQRPPIVILDEVEARDAWKCEKEEIKTSQNEIINIDDYTEDFSLHLDDTRSKTVNKENCVQKENVDKESEEISEHTENKQTKNFDVGSAAETKESNQLTETESSEPAKSERASTSYAIPKSQMVTEKRNIETAPVISVETSKSLVTNVEEKSVNTESCIQNKIKERREEKKEDNKTQMLDIKDKASIPKRRIALITLSSPKHKKKN